MDLVGLRLVCFEGKAHLDLLALHALALCLGRVLILLLALRVWQVQQV
jgi:hypothetical protein